MTSLTPGFSIWYSRYFATIRIFLPTLYEVKQATDFVTLTCPSLKPNARLYFFVNRSFAFSCQTIEVRIDTLTRGSPSGRATMANRSPFSP